MFPVVSDVSFKRQDVLQTFSSYCNNVVKLNKVAIRL